MEFFHKEESGEGEAFEGGRRKSRSFQNSPSAFLRIPLGKWSINYERPRLLSLFKEDVTCAGEVAEHPSILRLAPSFRSGKFRNEPRLERHR